MGGVQCFRKRFMERLAKMGLITPSWGAPQVLLFSPLCPLGPTPDKTDRADG